MASRTQGKQNTAESQNLYYLYSKKENAPALREDEESLAIDSINKADEKLPTISQLHEINKENADKILTEIQNGIITRVKQEQIIMKKAASNELKDLIRKLSELNKRLENNPSDETRKEFHRFGLDNKLQN